MDERHGVPCKTDSGLRGVWDIEQGAGIVRLFTTDRCLVLTADQARYMGLKLLRLSRRSQSEASQ